MWAHSRTYHKYLNKHNSSQRFTSFITISQLLEFNVKIQCDRYKQITTTTESSVPWRDLNFPIRFAAKHCSIAQLFGCSYQVYAAICCKSDSKLCRGKLFNRKRKPHTMSEKWHKINKFANYQNIIVRNSPALDRHVFCSFAKPLIYDFWRNAHDQYTSPLARPLLTALQVVRTSFGFHLRECVGSSSPSPDRHSLI